jgi:hypothetical protein
LATKTSETVWKKEEYLSPGHLEMSTCVKDELVSNALNNSKISFS